MSKQKSIQCLMNFGIMNIIIGQESDYGNKGGLGVYTYDVRNKYELLIEINFILLLCNGTVLILIIYNLFLSF